MRFLNYLHLSTATRRIFRRTPDQAPRHAFFHAFWRSFLGTPFLAGAALIAMTASFPGCAGKTASPSDPTALYNDALEDIKSDHYQMALDKLREVKNKFPYSKVAVDAQLKIADVYFAQEQWPEAAAAYETFHDLHPRHDRVAYAMYRAAKSYFKDIPDPIARDMTPARKTVDAYQEFIRQFPDAPETPQAKLDLDRALELLAEKELYIGDFYYKRDFYESAKGRYQKILDLYPETEAATEARAKLAKVEENLSKSAK